MLDTLDNIFKTNEKTINIKLKSLEGLINEMTQPSSDSNLDIAQF